MIRPLATFSVLLLAALPACADAPYLWIEAEQAAAQHDIAANAVLNKINPNALSGGAWLSSFSEPTAATAGSADYEVTIPAAGRYHLWLRGAIGTGLSYRVDGGAWVAVKDGTGIDSCSIAPDGGIWWPPPVLWFDTGASDIDAGKHTLSVLLGGTKQVGKAAYAALDCMALTTGDFTPNAKYRPDDKDAPKPSFDIPPGRGWDFLPPKDKLDPASLLDLRYLNEKVAGEHGFIRVTKDGTHFARGDGKPIRFWAIHEGPDLDLAGLKQHAQFLAKRGVNIVRLFSGLQPKKEGSKVTDVDEAVLDLTFRQVAAMKSAGIYSIIEPYWGNACTIRKSWGTMGDPGQSGTLLLFFDPVLQQGYKAWLKALYDRPNPYTGTRLADDPGVAIIQLQNENSLLFWDLNSLKGKPLEFLRGLYKDFLVAKYGSLEKCRTAWQNYNPPASEIKLPMEWDKGLPGWVDIWDFSRAGMAKKGKWAGFSQCSADQVEFLSRLMRQFNADMIAYLRKDLGCKQLVNCGNWHGADGLTQDAEYWSGLVGDVVARNNYTGGYHVGNNVGWQVLTGSYYSNISVIKQPTSLPVNMKHVMGHPVITPESTWVQPNLYQSEGPLMVAAQSALTGFDALFWFVQTSAEWTDSTTYKWSCDLPMILGQFPAAALIYRQGLVKEAAPSVVENRPLQDLWNRAEPLIVDENGWDDPNHSAGANAPKGGIPSFVDQLAYLVGPVMVSYGSDPAKNKIVNLRQYIDRANKTVRSSTGEILTDFGRGVYRVNAPRAQGAAGFLGAAGPQDMDDVTIACRNPYASIVVVSLDGKPIKTSEKLLVQVGTINRPTGWQSQPYTLIQDQKPFPCLRLVDMGKAPWQVENTDATVTVSNPNLTTATALDVNGMPVASSVSVTRTGAKLTIDLPKDVLYLVLGAASAGGGGSGR